MSNPKMDYLSINSEPSLVEALLQISANDVERRRTSFSLTQNWYLEFQKNCKTIGVTPSRMLDCMMRDFNNHYKTKSEDTNVDQQTKET